MSSKSCPGCKRALDSDDAKFCPECGWKFGSPALDQDAHKAIKFAIDRARVFVADRGNAPWLIIALAITLGAVAFMAYELWIGAVLAVVALYTLPLIYGWVTKSLTNRHVTRAIYGYFAIGAGALLMLGPEQQWHKADPLSMPVGRHHTLPPPPSHSPMPSMVQQNSPTGLPDTVALKNRHKQAEATANYWTAAVADLHMMRFSAPVKIQGIDDKSPVDVWSEYKQEIDRIKALPTVNVDPVLVEMSRRHIMIDEAMLRLVEQHNRWMAQKNGPIPKTGRENRLALQRDFEKLDTMTDEEYERLPEDTKYVLNELSIFADNNHQRWHDIKRMQGELTKQYGSNGVTFSLPDIEGAEALDAPVTNETP